MDITQVFISTIFWIVMIPLVKGKMLCDCTTLDCQAERRRTCEAKHFCYVEIIGEEVTRGCINNNRSPLLCENRKPTKLASKGYKVWPNVYCCKDSDFCNRDIVPIVPTEVPEVTDYETIDDENNPYVRHEYDDDDRAPCPNSNSSTLNPIYIAVPVAGVCVLLALIIFAMYLLRRRNDFYTSYEAYQYHEQLARLANKQNETKAQTCDTNNINRCTDSERSSQGSETKLFLNA